LKKKNKPRETYYPKNSTATRMTMSNLPEKKLKVEDEDEIEAAEQQKLDQELLDAALANETDKILDLISRGADVTHQEEEKGTSALMSVAAHGNVKAISALLKAGAVWNALDRQHKCAGDYATDAGQQV
jgi:protein arginine N-methyltransferase 2